MECYGFGFGHGAAKIQRTYDFAILLS